MNYELLKKEFSHLSSFLIWDDERIRNGLPPVLMMRNIGRKILGLLIST